MPQHPTKPRTENDRIGFSPLQLAEITDLRHIPRRLVRSFSVVVLNELRDQEIEVLGPKGDKTVQCFLQIGRPHVVLFYLDAQSA